MRGGGIAITFFLALAISLALTPAIRDFALRRGIVDAADSSRKLHTRPIPRLGGIAILCAAFSSLAVFLPWDETLRSAFAGGTIRVAVLLGGAGILGLIGLADDLRSIRARWKLLGQVFVAIAVFASGTRVSALACPGLGAVELGVFALPVTVIWIVGIVNAMNLIDGLDGLAGGVSLFALATIAAIAAFAGQPVTAAILMAAAGAVVGFLRYNFHPASIFMGDAGSMFLGYLLAVCSIGASQQSSTAIALGIPLAVLAVPIADTALSIGRRALRGRSVFSADREHIHHLLLDAGVSHRGAVLVLYGVSAIFCAVALAAVFVGGRAVSAAAAAVCACAALALRRLGFFRLEPGRRLGEERRRNRALRLAVNRMAFRLRGAATLPEVLDRLAPIPSVLAASRAEAIVPAAGLRRCFPATQAPDGRAFSARFPIGKPSLGDVEVHWNDGRERLDRDDEIALQRICMCVERAVRRIHPELVAPPEGAAEHSPATSTNVARPARTG